MKKNAANEMTQTDLFDKAPPLPTFACNSETSRQAAITKYDKRNSIIQREFIMSFLRERKTYGATREEIQHRFKLSGDSVRPRVKELLGEAKGWADVRIKLSGETRKTASGNNAEVLVSL